MLGHLRSPASPLQARLNELVEEGKLEKEDVQSRSILEALKGEQAAGGHACLVYSCGGREMQAVMQGPIELQGCSWPARALCCLLPAAC